MALVSSANVEGGIVSILVIVNGFIQPRHVVQAGLLQSHVNPDRD